ncbi:MAG: cell cycle protein [Planctomycetaceae bacterium]|nr:cell cycle protein [Planctomycetaceae bacterium]
MSDIAMLQRLPWTILITAIALMLAGLLGIERGDDLSGIGQLRSRQLVWIILSVPVMFAAIVVPYRRLRPMSYSLFLASLVLLVAVFFTRPINGARCWIPLGFMNFQPSELAKLAYILSLAHYLMYRQNYRRFTGLLVPFFLTLVPLGLILAEPDLGTALLFMPVLFSMLFASGARPRHLAFVIMLGIAISPLLWMKLNPEQKSRIVSVFRQQDGGATPTGDGFHLHQSKRVLALGGVWGSAVTGMPTDQPRAYLLPAARTDFVFCLIGERYGLIGCAAVFSLYLILFGRGLWIAAATREPFGRLVAVGIVSLLASQTIINTGMTVGLMPITGITLPLMSYGGSSLLFTCLALGLLMNIGMRPGYEIASDPFRYSSRGKA